MASILKRVDDITKDGKEPKNYTKQGILYLKKMLVGKGGEKNGK